MSEHQAKMKELIEELERIENEAYEKKLRNADKNFTNLDIKLLREFVSIDSKISELDTELKILKKRKAEIDPVLQEQFASAGIQNINIDGRTVYVSNQIWAKKEDGATDADVVAALKAAGFGEMYVSEKFSHQSLSALIREWVNNDEDLPEEFKGIIGYTEKTQVASRKSS